MLIVTPEVVVKVVSNPSIEVVTKSDNWVIVSAIGSLLLGISILATGAAWIWEHVGRNYFRRYRLDVGHDQEWVNENIVKIVDAFTQKTKFPHGTIYCIKIINKGTTHDYIYRAELDNKKGKKIDISTNCILSGSNYDAQNLPHGLISLQGEVWFVVAKDTDFIGVKSPHLIIHTAAKKYNLKVTDKMHVISKSEG